MKNQNIEGKIKDASWRLLFIVINENSLRISIDITISGFGINLLENAIDFITFDK
ncbi:hypothetical protein FOC93_00485 (plasmid) [Bacillus cereus]|uniref:hypothetical protein n=1 Tax=Bacillus cereus TaxID=1396 RepID=UPI00155FCCC6|nr:hypothetical protein [Bacillus cereus]QKH04712.1 hypothetical protein FOC93_00485 [Bacillus cereus]QKH10474.1 hypothetical protein FOC92_00115 [Bacillus cereus]